MSRSGNWRARNAQRAAIALVSEPVYFPDPLPGEALYSVIARYRHHRGHTHTALSLEIAGEEIRTFPINMPSNVAAVAKRMGSRQSWDARRLVLEHTGFRYYTAFLDEAMKTRVMSEMIEGDGKPVQTVGARAEPVGAATFIRFCTSCNAKAMHEHGEAYFHQIHQLPIVPALWSKGDPALKIENSPRNTGHGLA